MNTVRYTQELWLFWAREQCPVSPQKKYKQKSSIEGLLIGVDDAMAKILWSKYFIEAQGYNIAHSRLMQDNNIAIILGVNGKLFRSKRTKHILSGC